jgi:imidazolonepropionase-like amidohydrolase
VFVRDSVVAIALGLIALQLAAQDQLPTAKTLVIAHVTVIDGTGAPPRPDETVVVEHGRITRIGPAKSVQTPKDAQIVDAGGLYLLPGFWDMHVHG